ncbi:MULTISPECIES: glycosyltransferase family 4 protein [Microbacterium]|uniref:Glycosyltransferase involved in cell wall bisynthesis n=1 Tax=Microbacterium saccharophilum TaxID=1213358 RepID=A0A7Z7CZN9_9MICO|nr:MULTISPECIES: glycosyltransferase family 1 protein [Microbacterium]SFI75740.1 Glycosyltransferase involved in cell wall bisynthesis [Microbacterium saccharophilum]
MMESKSMPTRVFVNGRFLTQPMTGVQRFASEVTRALAEQTDLTVIAPPGDLETVDLGKAAVVQTGRLSGHAWEQIDLPRYLRRAGTPTLLNLASTGPVLYRPQFVTHHDITYVRFPSSFSRAFRLLYRLLIPPLLRRSEMVITVSEFSKAEIASHYRIPLAKILVVPNGVSDLFGPDGACYASAPYLLAVSSPNLHKNFGRLERAFDSAHLTTLKRLVVVGSQDRVFSSTSVSGSDRVKRLGRVADDELAVLYRSATAFAFPSLYEGFGIPPLEAQRSSCPVISSDAASMREVLGESVLYFDPTDEASIRDAIERIDSDPALRADLIARGAKNAARFTWERSATTIRHTLADRLHSATQGGRTTSKEWSI